MPDPSTLPDDAIAIVGMAMRFPGGIDDEDAFWRALLRGADLVTQVPAERWATDELKHPRRAEPGRSITFAAGVLPEVGGFDAAFFGISPREAATLDPQQRLMLELAWEVLENGGQRPSRLAGSDTAVYVGVSSLDNGMRGLDDLATMSAHAMTGNTLSIVANRISYAFDLHGPSLALDSACSSSLVAVHQACMDLRHGEASAAFAGGVNLLLHPYSFVGFTKASMLARGERCRAFDADGDGYVRAEGAAMLFLKRARDALADGDPIQALILASATNTDGARKTGLTIPSGAAQAQLMRRVLDRSGVAPSDVDFIEAHGTGTPVGDPVEAAAIGAVYGQARPPDAPLPIGSVKTNLGHLEPVSGLAGVIKSVLALRHRTLPASLHWHRPNPHIDFAALNLAVATQPLPLRAPAGRPLRAGVNSFGFGGANAHVLLQEFVAPAGASHDAAAADADADADADAVLVFSARSDGALRALAARYAALLEAGDAVTACDIAHAAATRRDRLARRAAIAVVSPPAAAGQLACFARGEPADAVVCEDALPEAGGVAFVYSGNGAQWLGMGRRLWSESARFRDAFEHVALLLQSHSGIDFPAEMHADAAASRIDDTRVAQPLLFAMQVAITTWLREAGIEPDAVAGHSVGEVAAAWAAGALDLDQAARVICARSAAQAATRGGGRMAVLALPAGQAREWLHAPAGEVEIAGINAPGSVTLCGPLAALEAVRERAQAEGAYFRLLDLDHAFHSRQMDAVRAPLAASLDGLAPRAGVRGFVSCVSGAAMDGRRLDAHYWWRNVREPVRFADAIGALAAQGCRVFVEIGPQAILQRYIGESLAAAGVQARVLSTLRRDDDGHARLVDASLRIGLLSGAARRDTHPARATAVRLPNYPWQREPHVSHLTPEAHALIQRRRVHPLLGWRLSEVGLGWENTLDPVATPWLADHRVGSAVVFPAAGFVEVALAAVRAWRGDARIALEEIAILSPLVFDEGQARVLRVFVDAHDGGIRILSRPRVSGEEWTLHATARALDSPRVPAPCLALPAGPAALVEGGEHYRLARALGLDYGPAFRGIRRARVLGTSLEADVDCTAPVREGQGYLLHPAMLDLCFQAFVGLLHVDLVAGRGSLFLPIHVGRVDYFDDAPVATIRARLRRRGARSLLADFELVGAAGELVARVTGSRSRTAPVQRRDDDTPATWRLAARLRPHPLELRFAPAPAPAALLAEVHAGFADDPSEGARQAWYRRDLPLLDALALVVIRDAVAQILRDDAAVAWQPAAPTPGNAFLRWAVALLQQERLLEHEDGRWRLREDGDLPPAQPLWAELWRDAAHCAPTLALLACTATDLPALLKGEIDGAAWHRSVWRSPWLDGRHAEDPAYRGTHRALLHALRTLAAAWPAGRRLRVLELGSDGALARAACGAGDIDYLLALDDDAVRLRLQGDLPDLLGIELTLAAAQGVDSGWRARRGGFDVVVLHHCLHRERDPRTLLADARRVLAAGGLLLVAERHPDWHVDLLEGADPSWWQQDADVVPCSPLRSPDAWRALLDAGHDEIAVFSEPAAEGLQEGAYLIMARRPAHDAPRSPVPPRTWRLLADDASAGFAQRLAERLRERSHAVSIGMAPEAADRGAHELVYLRQWECTPPAASAACADWLDCLRIASLPGQSPSRPWMISRGGALADDAGDTARPVQAALWGLARVAMNEHPALECVQIDIGDAATDDVCDAVMRELAFPDGADEIVLRGRERRQLRWESARDTATRPPDAPAAFRLDFRAPGQLRHLQWKPLDVGALRADQIEVRPRAVGLNFRDVMYTMGLLPDEAVENGFAGASLGLEFAGVVSRVGDGVHDLVPGDAVLGFGPACFASHVTTRRDAVALIPPGWTFDAAASVPTAFFTAWYALAHLAALQPGERVLIHGAAGGVGLAAMQVARQLGAQVFATAGSAEKRELLRWLGATHVFDSRRLDFADEILAATAGEGVDAVLNSLSGEAVRRSLQVLGPLGRFLELGKRDFHENTRIGLRPLRGNIAYHGIDADRLLLERPELAARLFAQVMQHFRDGSFAPLPHRVFDADRVVEAFRTMQQARHAGKLVVSMERAPSRIERPHETDPVSPLRGADGTWLVTGGLGGFGLATAHWLAQRGVRHLVLAGRRGLDTPGAREAVDALRARGVDVLADACDVADRDRLAALLAKARERRPPLAGVVHAAMGIDDGLLADLDEARLEAALRPKLTGAWHLHELTRGDALSHFVLYSSVTAWLGSPGQGNYVAANAALEALARLRRGEGLPATCIAWGPIDDTGFLARNEAMKAGTRRRMGADALSSAGALRCLDEALSEGTSGRCVADFDWSVLSRLLPSAQRPRFAGLATLPAGAQDDESVDLRARIAGKSPAEVFELVRGLVREDAARILCLAVDRIEPHRSLRDAGMDSLMAVELAFGLEQRFGFQLPVMALNEGPSVDRIARRIADALLGGGEAATPAPDGLARVVGELARRHGETATPADVDLVRRELQHGHAGETP